jgi:ABC-type uncharacterized transport system fused permease/ATPase subunit
MRHMGVLAAFNCMLPAVKAGHIKTTESNNSASGPAAPASRMATKGCALSGIDFLPSADGLASTDVTEYFLTSLHMMVSIATAMRDFFGLTRSFSTINGQAERLMDIYDRVAERDASLAKLSATAGLKLAPGAESVVIDGLAVHAPAAEGDEAGPKELMAGVNVKVAKGEKGLLIKGPNGSGKTSLFRVLAGVWEPTVGTVTMPPVVRKPPGAVKGNGVMFLPQRPYLVPGASLRQNLMYPAPAPDVSSSDCNADSTAAAASSPHDLNAPEVVAMLLEFGLLKADDSTASPESVLDDAARFNPDRLSPGQRQKLCAVRLLLARPAFAFVDEATAHTDATFEGLFFSKCADLGITLVTISHSVTGALSRYHDKVLTLDGSGGSLVGPASA